MAKLDDKTLELPGLEPLSKKRGRPATGIKSTSAVRMRRLREARSAELKEAKKSERRRSDAELAAAIAVRLELDDMENAKLAWLELGRRRGWRL